MNNIVDYKKISNLCDIFKYQLHTNPDDKFLFTKIQKKWIGHSFFELNEEIIKIKQYLFEKNITKGDRVLLLSNSRIEWFIIDMAIMSTGAITVPCFSTNNLEDNLFILKDSRPSLIFLENFEVYKKNFLIFKNFKDKIIFIEKKKRFFSIDKIINKKKLVHEISISSEDVCSIIYTSGTSGNPKGVVLSHGSIIHNCKAAQYLLKDLNIGKEKFLSFLPLSHSYERMAGLYFPLSIGATIFFCDSVDRINKDLIEVKPTIVTAVPRFYENIYRKIKLKFDKSNLIEKFFIKKTIEFGHRKREKKIKLYEKFFDLFLNLLVRKKVNNIFGGKLKTFVSGGAALNPEIGDFFLNFGCNILQGYGQTEAGPLISCNEIKNNDTSTVGRPIRDVEVKITNSGEIIVKGENIMKGYWKNKGLTNKTIINGWLYTGDLGYFDNKKRLVINGRKKDLIVTSGGENISPQKIENLLVSYEEIIQSLVYGDSKPYIVAILVCKENIKKNRINTIISQVNSKLNSIEKIRKYTIKNDEFTRENGLLTQTLKIKRNKVILNYFEEIEKLY